MTTRHDFGVDFFIKDTFTVLRSFGPEIKYEGPFVDSNVPQLIKFYDTDTTQFKRNK